jgi:hypothetical protein
MDALQREIPKINATAKNSAERIEALRKMYQRVLPPELVERYRRTVAGVAETFNTAIFGPETGLFGLGRKMKGLGKKLNEFGQYVDWYGNVTDDVNKAMNADLSLYDMVRDVVANTGQVLAPIVENITLLWDPLRSLGKLLSKARVVTADLLRSFNIYVNGWEDFAKTLNKSDLSKFVDSGGKELRASISTIANLLRAVGAISAGDFAGIQEQLKNPNANMAAIMKGMVDTFLNSKAAYGIGEFVGQLIGTVLVEVSKVTGFISGRLEGSNQLVKGVTDGFKAAGGEQAFANIFKDVIFGMMKVLKILWDIVPWQAKLIAVGMLILPAAIQGIAMSLAEKLVAGLSMMSTKCGNIITRTMGGACPTMPGGTPGGGRPGRPGRTARNIGAAFIPGTPRQKIQTMRNMSRRGQGIGQGFGLLRAFGKDAASAAKMPKAVQQFVGFAKKLPGLSIALGALDFAFRKSQGQGTGEAAGGAIGAGVGGTAGAVLGSALGPAGTIAGGFLGAWLGDWLGSNIGKVLQELPAKLSGAWEGFKAWLSNSFDIGYLIGSTVARIQMTWDNFVKWWQSLGPKFDQMVAGWIKGAQAFFAKAQTFLSSPSEWLKLAQAIITGVRAGISNAINGIGNWFSNLGKGFQAGFTETKGGYTSTATQQRQASGTQVNPIFSRAKGGLGDAIASEMRMKPPGSNLVIANSSETVIPAAGGYGMIELLNVFRSGFQAMVSTYTSAQEKQQATLKAIQSTLINNQAQTNARLMKLETKFTTPGLSGGLGGGSIGGGVDSFTGMAQKAGLIMTSGYRPGDPGWHGANRARDYSNGTGPTPQMLQFAQMLATNYGANLKELIYTPLGFSIKNGKRVPPYAQAAHYNHVHVAAAMGLNNAVAFGSLSSARQFESSMMPTGARVASVTANSSEFGGGPTLNNSITIVQAPGQDSEELAATVLQYLGDWVADARASSIFV